MYIRSELLGMNPKTILINQWRREVRVWEAGNTFCWMQQKEDSKANISPHKKRCLRFTFPPQNAPLHTFKDPVILLFVPNSYPANSTLDLCFSSGTGIVYTDAPEVHPQTEDWDHSWQERKNKHPSRSKYYHCDAVRLSASQMDWAWRTEGLAQAIKREAKYKWIDFRKYTAPKEDERTPRFIISGEWKHLLEYVLLTSDQALQKLQ